MRTQTQASSTQTLKGEGDCFPKQQSFKKCLNAEAQTSGNSVTEPPRGGVYRPGSS
jgi:hypothetical protein